MKKFVPILIIAILSTLIVPVSAVNITEYETTAQFRSMIDDMYGPNTSKYIVYDLNGNDITEQFFLTYPIANTFGLASEYADMYAYIRNNVSYIMKDNDATISNRNRGSYEYEDEDEFWVYNIQGYHNGIPLGQAMQTEIYVYFYRYYYYDHTVDAITDADCDFGFISGSPWYPPGGCLSEDIWGSYRLSNNNTKVVFTGVYSASALSEPGGVVIDYSYSTSETQTV